ncbi:MAG: SDR family oxidoreductase [Sulfurospirillaceae bacterium]|nr:SDR family oxidoreductase [Sulfurospirillaceae bacterium]
MKYILIVGAKSDIAKELARVYAKAGYALILAARDHASLSSFQNDLQVRYGIDVQLKELDIINTQTHATFYAALEPKPYGTIVAVGYLGEQEKAQQNWCEAENILQVNFFGPLSLLNDIAQDYEVKKEGFIVGISSVAGDRGRQTNYFYGASKAGFSTYLSGLRNRLAKYHVQVLTVKPGFVATKMTEHLELPSKLTAQADEVAQAIFTAQQKGKDVVYVKLIWRFIMLAIIHIPEKVFKKMKL